MTLGVKDLLIEWTAFRTECVKRRTYFELSKARDRLHLLKGLQKILLDIDKAIKIIRETDEEDDVVPNLMIGFGIDEIQAEYVAEIKLRHLNREYILKRIDDIDRLEKSISDMEDILSSKSRIKKIIISELKTVSDKYGADRKTQILFETDEESNDDEENIPDFNTMCFFTRDGYFKKITLQSWRMGNNHKLKEGDEIIFGDEISNASELLFFTDKNQVYKSRVADFDECKASSLGDFVGSKLHVDDGENVIYMVPIREYYGYMLFFFENGKVAKVDISAYETKTNRNKLIKAYSDKQFILSTTAGRYLIFNTGSVSSKTTKDTQGVAVMTLKKGHKLCKVEDFTEDRFAKPSRYRTKTLPSVGATLSAEDTGEQLRMDE